MVERDYKFYLAFENSICVDYVTEKFFNAMRRTVVPITLGGANYSSLAPFHSAVHVDHRHYRHYHEGKSANITSYTDTFDVH